jgi:hypothetical protein
MSEDWLTKIKEMKKKEDDMNADLEATKKAWTENKEKHKDERNKIIELINSESKKIAEIYTDESAKRYSKPKVTGNDRYVSLSMTIERQSLSRDYEITFSLESTEKGYRVDVHKGNGASKSIFPPVTVEAIQKELVDFISDRNNEIGQLISEEKKDIMHTY